MISLNNKINQKYLCEPLRGFEPLCGIAITQSNTKNFTESHKETVNIKVYG